MARALALACDYAARREAFGRPLIEQPLHARTLADMRAEFEGAFALAFEVVQLLGRVEQGQAASHETALLRLLTPLAKLWTGKVAEAAAILQIEELMANEAVLRHLTKKHPDMLSEFDSIVRLVMLEK